MTNHNYNRCLLVVLLQTLFLFVSAANANTPKVLTTTSFLKDITQEIVGDEYEVISIMPVGGDPHIYDPVPQDAKLVSDADLIIKNGLYLEGWLNKLIDNSGTKAFVIEASDNVEAIVNEEYHGAPDPHAWMDAQNAVIYAGNIRDALVLLNPEKRKIYSDNFESFEIELKKLDLYIRERIKEVPVNQRVLITSHDAFKYYGYSYGLQLESAMGTSTDAEVQIKDVKRLIEVIKERAIPAIFVESTINPKLLEQIASDLDIIIGGNLFADSLGDEDSGADTYVKMMKQNTDIIVNALKNPAAQTNSGYKDFLIFLSVMISLFLLVVFVVGRNLITSGSGIDLSDFKIEIKGLSVSYEKKNVLSNIYLTMAPGKLYGLIGPNGAGKSTLFKSILGLLSPDAGEVSIGGQDVGGLLKHIAYIPQKGDIDWEFPSTVYDIVLMGRYPHLGTYQKISALDIKIANDALEQVGILDLENKQIGELSGGQQQRVFLARALCQQAEIYLFDEPFVGVDITTEEKMMEILKELANTGKTILVIHHDLSKVDEYFDEVILLNQRLVAFGNTDEVFTDENIRKTYSGKLTLLHESQQYV